MVAMSKSRPRVLNFFSKARPSTEIRGQTGAAGKTPLKFGLACASSRLDFHAVSHVTLQWCGTGHQGQATAFAILFTTLIVL
jgi:hypothetical protein